MISKITEIKFFNQFNNGAGLDTNLTAYAGGLIGNVTDMMRASYKVEVSWVSQSDTLNTFYINGNTLTRVAGSFIDDSFELGDKIELWDSGSDVLTGERTITHINATSLDFDGAAITADTLSSATLYGKTPLTSIKFRYGLIGSGESANYVSKIDGTAENLYKSASIGIDSGSGRDTSQQQLVENTGVSSWIDTDAIVKVNYDSSKTITDNYAQVFIIDHTFNIFPYYLQGFFSGGLFSFYPSLFASSNCLRYVTDLEFSNSLTKISTKTVSWDPTQYSTGFFNENLNGNASIYSYTTAVFTDSLSSASVTALQAQKKTSVSFSVISSGGNFDTKTNLVVGVSALPQASEYQQNTNTINTNFVLDKVITEVGISPASGLYISNYSATLVSATQVDISFDVDFTSIDTSYLYNKEFIVFCATGDKDADPNSSDRVTLLVERDTFIYDTDVDNLFYIDSITHFPHEIADTSTGFDNIKGWIEDGFEIVAPMQLNVDASAELRGLKVCLSAYNSITGERFDLQTYTFNLASYVQVFGPSSTSAKAFNVHTTRGFQLLADSQFNKAVLESGTFSTRSGVNVFNYTLYAGIKANFEEWIAQPGADSIFYDITQPQNGLNKNASRYSLKNDFAIVTIVEADVYENITGTTTNYQIISEDHDFHFYDEDGNTAPLWTADIISLNSDGINTSGVINTSENFTIKATFTPAGGTTEFVDPIGIIRLVPEGGNISTIRETSTINGAEFEGYLDAPILTDTGTEITLEATLDASLLDANSNYTISARLFDNALIVGLATESSVLLLTETGTKIIIE